MATNRVVSKKELEDSGMSLRDFLNQERKLTRKAPEGTKFGVNAARPSAADRATMNAQDNANRGLDENGRPLQEQAYTRRDQYRESGKAAVDKMEEADRRDKTMAAYTPRRDANAAARVMLSSGKGDEAGNAMKHGGRVKAAPKRATGYRGYGIAKKV